MAASQGWAPLKQDEHARQFDAVHAWNGDRLRVEVFNREPLLHFHVSDIQVHVPIEMPALFGGVTWVDEETASTSTIANASSHVCVT